MALDKIVQKSSKLYFLDGIGPKNENVWKRIQKEQESIFWTRYGDGVDYKFVEDKIPFEVLKKIASRGRSGEPPEISLVFVADAKKYEQDRIEIRKGDRFWIRKSRKSPILAYDILQNETLNVFCVYRGMNNSKGWFGAFYDGVGRTGFNSWSHRFPKLLSDYKPAELKKQAEYRTGIDPDLILFLREKVIENMVPDKLKNTLINYLR